MLQEKATASKRSYFVHNQKFQDLYGGILPRTMVLKKKTAYSLYVFVSVFLKKTLPRTPIQDAPPISPLQSTPRKKPKKRSQQITTDRPRQINFSSGEEEVKNRNFGDYTATNKINLVYQAKSQTIARRRGRTSWK